MDYGDEYLVKVSPGFDLDMSSNTDLENLFKNGICISSFKSSPNGSFTHDSTRSGLVDSMCYKVDEDGLIEINDAIMRTPTVLRNQVSDLISFQFVSTVKRSELLGERRNVHNLGPAIIVSAIPNPESTYRLPKINQHIRHVMVHTTLSNLMERLGESSSDYPKWLQEILNGDFKKPRQRVLFLDGIHRDLTWSCFHLPVSDTLLKHWLSTKFHELLCIGLQVLKNNESFIEDPPSSMPFPREAKIRKASQILNREYASPPALPVLAKRLGMSETQLKSGFKSMKGTTILQYCIDKRIDAAKLLLNENKYSISEISDIVGYQDHSAFSRAFRRRSGCSPRQWRLSANS